MTVAERTLSYGRWLAVLTLLSALAGCSAPRNAQEARSITVLVGMPQGALDPEIVREFTSESGISVRFIPGSESASRRLEQELTLLREKSAAVDVFQIDTIWPAILANDLIDLRPALQREFAGELPLAVENATVKDRVVAAPFLLEYGVLYYRTDLLRKYGFQRPPRTWDELETQASRIQRGERARGQSDFWGYVWQGGNYEGLTCNALEWQYSQGGGNLLEPDRTVNVANRAAIRAFARAARWVGTISPPGVTAYLEEDSRNMWQSGRAAFLRNWSSVQGLAEKSKEVAGRYAVAPLPVGDDPHSSVLGGWYLGVSRYTHHQAEALAFVRYLNGKQVQRQRAIQGRLLPTYPSLYQDPILLRANLLLAPITEVPKRLIQRPAALAGRGYDRVSRAYADGIHQILTRKLSAPEGAANIQSELVRITGFANSTQVVSSGSDGEQR